MGAENKVEVIKKFGEILINISANKKSKVYIFKCVFCNANYEQLKKFSLHLDEKHLQEFLDEPLTALPLSTVKNEMVQEVVKDDLEIAVPEINVNALMAAGTPDDKCGIVGYVTRNIKHEDPLETSTPTSTCLKANDVVESDMDMDDRDSDGDGEQIFDFNSANMEYNDSVDGSDSESDDINIDNYPLDKEIKSKRRCCKFIGTVKDFSGDSIDGRDNGSLLFVTQLKEFSGDSHDGRDTDFNINRVNRKTTNTFSKKQETIIIKTMLVALEKQPVIWDIKKRSNDKTTRRNGFKAIAKEVNDQLKLQIHWEHIRKRIQDIRNEYSKEYEKQLKGEVCKMPWYVDSVKFLEENIQELLKDRDKKRKYRRLTKLDESHIPIIIEYYRKYEILWQVNNIAFVVRTKKKEALKSIIEDLKVKHNMDVTIHDIQRRLDYINRIYSTDKEQQLKCELDKSEFVPSSKYYAELNFLTESQGPFRCIHCNEILQKFESFRLHVAEHTKSKPFKCALCEKEFLRLVQYVVHAKRHLDMGNFHCDVCGKVFPFSSSLKWHMSEHTGIELFLCEICGASFRARHGYDNHIRRHENRFRFECEICKQGFNYNHALEAHVKVHLDIRDILCNVCGKGFTLKKHLNRHKLIHSDTKRYKCGVCGKAFAQDAGLRAHRKQHIEYSSLSEIARQTAFRKGKYKYD